MRWGSVLLFAFGHWLRFGLRCAEHLALLTPDDDALAINDCGVHIGASAFWADHITPLNERGLTLVRFLRVITLTIRLLLVHRDRTR